jgi:hypothetical protein
MIAATIALALLVASLLLGSPIATVLSLVLIIMLIARATKFKVPVC